MLDLNWIHVGCFAAGAIGGAVLVYLRFRNRSSATSKLPPLPGPSCVAYDDFADRR